MRSRRALAAFLATLILVSLLACGSGQGGNNASPDDQVLAAGEGLSSKINSENPLIGTWVSGEYSLTFTSENTYLIGLKPDGSQVAWGNVTISGNVVIFSESAVGNPSGRKDGGQIVGGTYTYTIYGTTLILSPVLDLCRDRANILCLRYQKR
ncbi:MAG TPA: hypothetical protein VEM40_02335 [Nitrospirota bacterium]|nr:hypothetical protein [Nitrospirota bacterium]